MMTQKTPSNKIKVGFLISLFIFFSLFWVYANSMPEDNDTIREIFSGSYGLLALVGAGFGFVASKEWGGRKSLVGKALLLFSIGLLLQEFGQISYSFYTFAFQEEIPYPSIGDIGYFGSIFFYIFGGITLVRALTSKQVLQSPATKIKAIAIPAILLAVSYFEFLKGYEVDSSAPVVTFLDFGYPFGQAIYISLGILIYLLSRKYLGGRMRPAVLLLLVALVLQYASDFVFLYQTSRETWVTAGFNDYMYALSYLVMGLALVQFSIVYESLNSPSTPGGRGVHLNG